MQATEMVGKQEIEREKKQQCFKTAGERDYKNQKSRSKGLGEREKKNVEIFTELHSEMLTG